ncbi:MAG: hypothetical protein JWL85_73 [Candidatus Saccharibacteria bacterium]|nr:hypothetical protein [Candidatus Saccharibacteria bacterium]
MLIDRLLPPGEGVLNSKAKLIAGVALLLLAAGGTSVVSRSEPIEHSAPEPSLSTPETFRFEEFTGNLSDINRAERMRSIVARTCVGEVQTQHAQSDIEPLRRALQLQRASRCGERIIRESPPE